MQRQQTAGFTIVELLVTIVVGSLFMVTIYQLFIAQGTLAISEKTFTTADQLAYRNMREYAYGRPPTWFECTYNVGATSPNPMTLVDRSETVDGLPSPVRQVVTATAPYGCGGDGASNGYPIRVVSTVTYGVGSQEVSHATYASY